MLAVINVERAWPQSALWSLATRNRILVAAESKGTLELYIPKPGVLVSRVRGTLSQAMAQRWIAVMEPRIGKGEVFHVLNDWEYMDHYESGARRDLTEWVVSTIRNYRSVHVLVASKIVAMGVSAAGLSLALVGLRMISHSSRAKFDGELAQVLT
jgi:hypothetical protein